MFGVHQPHPDDPHYPKWCATHWPRPYIKESGGFKIVAWDYFPVEWFERGADALERQTQIDKIKYDWDALYSECEAHNKPLRKDDGRKTA